MTSIRDKRINAIRGTPRAPVWQRDDYEHIIRNESALRRNRQYNADNPAGWSVDPENPAVRDVQDPFGALATGRSPLVYGPDQRMVATPERGGGTDPRMIQGTWFERVTDTTGTNNVPAPRSSLESAKPNGRGLYYIPALIRTDLHGKESNELSKG